MDPSRVLPLSAFFPRNRNPNAASMTPPPTTFPLTSNPNPFPSQIPPQPENTRSLRGSPSSRAPQQPSRLGIEQQSTEKDGSSGEGAGSRNRGRPPGSRSRGRPPGSRSRGRPPGSRGRGRPPGSRGRGRPPDSGKKQLDALGTGFVPNIIAVEAGEDIVSKVMALKEEGRPYICILSATGAVSSVNLCYSTTPGSDVITYEGRYEIVSLSGSFTATTESSETVGITGRMSVCLADQDGEVLVGVVAGELVASSRVEITVGSFGQAGRKRKQARQLVITDSSDQSEDHSPPSSTDDI